MDNKDALDELITATMIEAASGQAQPPGPCPEPHILASYIDGAISEGSKEDVEGHLCLCPDCFGVVVSARESLKPGGFEKAAPALIRKFTARTARKNKLLEVVVRFVYDALELVSSTGLDLSPALAVNQRGKPGAGRKLLSLQKGFDKILIELDVERTDKAEVAVFLRAMRLDDHSPYDGLRASLFLGDRERSSIVMEDGWAAFESLQPSPYTIRITEAGALVGQVDLKIKGSRHEG